MKHIIKLKDWDYTCGDGCCYEYGIEIEMDGELCDNEYSGDSVTGSLEFVLTKLGIEFEIIRE